MKKKKIVLFVFLIVGILSLILTYKFKQNNLSKNKPIKEEKLSIMIKEDGATDYTKSSSKDIPKGDYILNEEKTHCENNGQVTSYDNSTGTVSFSFIGSDKCYLYFDYKEDTSLYGIVKKRYNNGDEFVKLYNGADYGDTTTYANNIYYYTGNVENNNVFFANYCWKIVRTTDTGGVKIVYNGTLNDGSCNNTGTNSQIGTSAFNSNFNSPAYVGYMYNENKVYTYSNKSMSSQSNIVFGNSFTYANGTYTLKDTKTVATWSSGYDTINNNHYTCMTTGTTCSSIYYVYDTNSSYAYYITLTGGKSVSDALNEMLYADDVNTNDSTIKAYIDNWYKNNMTSYTNKLEDTVFCNDRSISNLAGWNPNGGSTSTLLYFKNNNIRNKSLVCANETDRFTVSTSNGNGKLTYPVGLLTVPELSLAGYGSSHYFNNAQFVWLGSPNHFDMNNAYVWGVYSGGWNLYNVSNTRGVRSAVSIKPDTTISSGDGSYTSPFVIE